MGSSGMIRFDTDARFLGLLKHLPTERGTRDCRELATPLFTRPNDPVMAAELRLMVEETVDESIEAGAAEIVSEFALPLQSRALALLLNVPLHHAEEWISWGYDDATVANDTDPAIAAYVDRQIERALRDPGTDFFSLLTRATLRGAPIRREDAQRCAILAISNARREIVNRTCGTLAWLALHPEELAKLRERPELVSSTAAFLDAGDEHSRLVLRSIIKVVSRRIERLTVLKSDPIIDRYTDLTATRFGRLLLMFKPL